jgi:putative ABC transport system permease protein
LTTINSNFTEMFSTDEADAGWDVSVATNPSNPIEDLRGALAGSEVNPDDIAAVGRIVTIAYSNSQARDPGSEEWERLITNGMNESYIDNAVIPLEARAPGYESDQAVWDAIRSGEPVAVADSFMFSDDQFGNDPDAYAAPSEVDIVDGTVPALPIELQSPRTGETRTVTVIGVIDSKVSTLFGLYTSEQVFNEIYGGPDFTNLFVQLSPDASVTPEQMAKDIESALLTSGVQAESINDLIEEQQAIQNGFLNLLQGFMGLGLLVGIAALGVIAFRSVVERRQQIGMLRAIGYKRGMVATSFLLESLVIAALGVLSGTILAVILSYNLVNSDDFQEGADFSGFVIPWVTIAIFVVASLVAAALMTWIPARKASSVPIAEALRYE